MAVRLSALRAGRPLPPGRFLVLISAAGRIRSIEKSSDLIGNRNRDFKVCSISASTNSCVSQPFSGSEHIYSFTTTHSWPVDQTQWQIKSLHLWDEDSSTRRGTGSPQFLSPSLEQSCVVQMFRFPSCLSRILSLYYFRQLAVRQQWGLYF
jgi:hypothetical protein